MEESSPQIKPNNNKNDRKMPSCLDDEIDEPNIKLFGFGAKHPHIKKEKWSS